MAKRDKLLAPRILRYITRILLFPTEYPFEFKKVHISVNIYFPTTIKESQEQLLKMDSID